MRILVGCEESQAVCLAFRERGHEAYSCDLQPCSGGHTEWHLQMDIFKAIGGGKLILQDGSIVSIDKWDMLIAHPPCTYLSYAGTAHWNKPGRLEKRLKALDFFAALWLAPIKSICLENPKGCASPTIAKYSQVIQPYYFGDADLKTTWLWLKNLPPLVWHERNNLFSLATSVGKPAPIYTDYTGKKRYFTDAIGGHHGEGNSTLKRSKTFPGIAAAMADQWG